MAMNKAEQKMVRDLRERLALARAVAWIDMPTPPPMTADEIKANLVDGGVKWGHRQKIARGYLANAHDRGQVYRGCSDGIHHGNDWQVTTTQGMGALYRTEADAWRWVRAQKAREFAKIMADIEDKIDAADAALSGAVDERVEAEFSA